jgi:TonB family protein
MNWKLSAMAVALLAIAGGACVADAAPATKTEQVPLVNSSKVPHGAVQYDSTSGKCSGGEQLMTQAEFKTFIEGWTLAPDCKPPTKSKVPSKAGYPDTFGKFRKSGSAHVLVRLDKDGSIESARAVCATDRDFAKAAEEAAKSIAYSPATCNGAPARDSFLLPFNYTR